MKAIKTISFLRNQFVLLLIMSLSVFNTAQAGDYETEMSQSISRIYQAATVDDLDQLANQFVQIGEAEKDKWHPYYYASLSQLYKSFYLRDVSKKDVVFDQAMVEIEKAQTIDPTNSEIEALIGFIHLMDMTLNPVERAQNMSPKIYASFGKALEINPDNPRAILFMAQMKMGTAEYFGQPIKDACSMVLKAKEKFDHAPSNDPLAPKWGNYGMDKWLSKCQ